MENPFDDGASGEADSFGRADATESPADSAGFFEYYRRPEPLPIAEEELLEIITAVIEPTDWEKTEGVFAKAVHRRILIRHTNAVHTKIKELAKRLHVKDFRELPTSGEERGRGFDNGGLF